MRTPAAIICTRLRRLRRCTHGPNLRPCQPGASKRCSRTRTHSPGAGLHLIVFRLQSWWGVKKSYANYTAPTFKPVTDNNVSASLVANLVLVKHAWHENSRVG